MDEFTTYFETFDALYRKKRLLADTTMLRFAALVMDTADLSEPYAQLEETAQVLRRGAGWFGPLRSSVRYVVAAMILRQGLPAERVHRQVHRTRQAMKKRRLPRAGLQTSLAALLLVLRQGGGPVPAGVLRRLEDLYQLWKEDHWWLTGSDDLPAAAAHAAGDQPVEVVGRNVERAYQQLHEAGFSRGQHLQLVAQLLSFHRRGVGAGVQRFGRLVDLFKEQRTRISSSRYDEVAILALTDAGVAAMVGQTLALRDRLRKKRPRPSTGVAFSLATGLALAGDLRHRGGSKTALDLASISCVQAVIAARQAAMAAAAGAAAASG